MFALQGRKSSAAFGIIKIMLNDILLFILGICTGGIAAIVGFGIGSFLTPILAISTGFGVAIAAVGIAHFFGSVVRFWLLRKDVNRRVLFRFGILSAVGGLAGALLQSWVANSALAVIFGGLMIFTGASTLLGWSEKLNIKGRLSWVAGALSGFFGGIVGNQGGLRAAGLVGFKLTKAEFCGDINGCRFSGRCFSCSGLYCYKRG